MIRSYRFEYILMISSACLVVLGGTLWAGPGEAALDVPSDLAEACRAVCTYELGQDRVMLARLDELTRLSADSPPLRNALADALAEAVSGQASDDAKAYFLTQLALVGSPRHVPALAPFLTHSRLSLPARSALHTVGGDRAVTAMIEALPTLEGPLLAGVIQSLGQSRARAALPALARYVKDAHVDVSRSAIKAMALIGGPQAAQLLIDSAPHVSDTPRFELSHALLQCAEGLIQAQKETLYGSLVASAREPAPVRRAAFVGLVACQADPDQAVTLLMEALAGPDMDLQSAALTCVRTEKEAQVRHGVARGMSRLPGVMQAPLIRALAAAQDPGVLPEIVPLLPSPVQDVQDASLEAIGAMGDASHVTCLVEYLKRVSPQSQGAVQDALERLAGEGTDRLMIAALEEARASGVQVSLMRVLTARQCQEAVPVWTMLIWNPNRAVQTQAIRSLGAMGDVTACPVLIHALDGTASSGERDEIEKAINEIAARLSYPDSLLDIMTSAVSQSSDQAKACLYRVAGRFGNQQALGMVRAGLKDTPAVRDACIRALGKWPNSQAIHDLLVLAEHADNSTHRILALRGFASLYGSAEDPPDVALAVRAFTAAERAEEKTLLLAVLPVTPGPEALRLVVSGLEDPALTEEAALALVRLARVMPDEQRGAVKSALKRAAKKTTSSEIRAQLDGLLIRYNRPPNLARGGTASSPDGWDRDGAAGGDPAGIDGDPETYWDEVNGKAEYRYRVTFKTLTTVSALDLMGYAQHSFAPRDFDILCDGRIVHSVREAAHVDNRFVVTFPATSCKTVELHITGSYGPSPAIRELELYHSPAGPSQEDK